MKIQGSQQDQLRSAARAFVAQAFFTPVLKQARGGALQTETGKMLSGGRGGEAFGAMLDQQRAQHLAGATGDQLVGAIVKRLS